ncbi:MAG: MbnH family di-heme enzyme [Candidatus Sericytochromatia bacterium]
MLLNISSSKSIERKLTRVFLSFPLLICAFFACQPAPAQHSPVGPVASAEPATPEAYRWKLPEGFPKPVVPADNPMTVAKVELGRHLFYDTRLSRDGSQSCASCHDPKRAFTDGVARPVGVTGLAHPRNSMALVNLAYAAVLTWSNPELKSLETQMLLPLFGEDPPELGLAGQEAILLERLRAEPRYQQLFAQAFPQASEPVSLLHLTQAIASFERSLVSADSPYDRYLYADDAQAMSDAALRGEALFFSERLECFHCHGGFNFSDASRHAASTFDEFSFHNTGLYNLDGKGAYPKPNTGLHELSHRAEDMGRFKAPTLRNIAVTAPYMHDGSIPTLEAVIDHYAAGGRAGDNPFKSAFVKGFRLSDAERADLLAFLHSLTDDSFLNNPAHASPW